MDLSPVSCSIRQELRGVLQEYLHTLCMLCRLSIALGDLISLFGEYGEIVFCVMFSLWNFLDNENKLIIFG